MKEDNFFIFVRINVLVGEFGIKFGVNGGDGIVLGEDVRKWDVLVLLQCSLLRETLWTKDLCGWIGLRPWTEVDMML